MSISKLINYKVSLNIIESTTHYNNIKYHIINQKHLYTADITVFYTINFRVYSTIGISNYEFNLTGTADKIDIELDNIVYSFFKHQNYIEKFIKQFDFDINEKPIANYDKYIYTAPVVFLNTIKSVETFENKIEKLINIINKFNMYNYNINNYNNDINTFRQIIKLKIKSINNYCNIKKVIFNINNVKILIEYSKNRLVITFILFMYSIIYNYTILSFDDIDTILVSDKILKLLTTNKPNILEEKLLSIRNQLINKM